MYKRVRQILFLITILLYFTISASQASRATLSKLQITTTNTQYTPGEQNQIVGSRYHSFFPKTASNDLQGVLHVQNAGNDNLTFQADFYNEQGGLVKRHFGSLPLGTAQTIAAQALTDLPSGNYAVRVTASLPVVSLVRFKDTQRTVPGLAFDPGTITGGLATDLLGGPVYGDANRAMLHLFNPNASDATGTIMLSQLTGTPSSTVQWALPAYGRKSVILNATPADFVGAVQVTASAPIVGLLQQKGANDNIDMQPLSAVVAADSAQPLLTRVLKGVAEAGGVYTTKLFVGNPNPSALSVTLNFVASEGQQVLSITETLNPSGGTLVDAGKLTNLPAGVYAVQVVSNALVIVTERTDGSTTTSANAAYHRLVLTPDSQMPVSSTLISFLPRFAYADYGYSVLNLQNLANSDAQFVVNSYRADGAQAGPPFGGVVPANGIVQRVKIPNLVKGGNTSLVVAAHQPLQILVDEYVLNATEPEPELGPPPPPVADFSATPTTGKLPLTVQFANTTWGDYTSSQWNFGDGQSSPDTNPTHTFTLSGDYTIKLTVNGPTGSHTATKLAYIKVQPLQPPIADFFATRTEGKAPLTIQLVNTGTGDYSSSQWNFGDGQSSTAISPTHTYNQPGVYTVALTVNGPAGNHTVTKKDYIKVRASSALHPDGWDLDFGNGGYVESDCKEWIAWSGVGGVQVTPDNKLLLYAVCNHQSMLLRFLADGAVDLSFGAQGRVPTVASLNLRGVPAIQGDGKIIMATETEIARHLVTGARDTAFSHDSQTLSQIGSFMELLVSAEDQIVVRGLNGVGRFTQDGILDSSFAGRGYLLTDAIQAKPNLAATQSLLASAVQPDGKLLVAIETRWKESVFEPDLRQKLVVVRLNRDGMVDQSFASAGRYTVLETADQGGGDALISVQPNGQILVTNSLAGRLLRLQTDGSLDPSFQGPTANFRHLLVDQQQAVVLQDPNVMQRLGASGLPDAAFGQGGRLAVNGAFLGMTTLQDGSLVVTVHDGTYKLLRNLNTLKPPTPPAAKPLVLFYAVLDNNLGDSWVRLVNNVEAGVRPGMNVRLLVDGPGANDVYIYQVIQDNNPLCPSQQNPTCNDRYVEGVNFWRFASEDTANPTSLYQFLIDSLKAHPDADKIALTLVGHGSGWSANVLPGQPSKWRAQEDVLGGMLWDDHPTADATESRSLSTLYLGQALQAATDETGKLFDLLYLDGCAMGMAEVAYEVRHSARYLLASPNIDWASFNYNLLLPETLTATTGRTLGERWLQLEANAFRANPGHPFTLSLLDLSQLPSVTDALSELATTLQAALPTQKTQIASAFAAAGHFDSDFDGDLDAVDAYVDLPDFLTQLRSTLPNESSIISTTRAISTALAVTIVAKDHQDGVPWVYTDQTWEWPRFGGLSLYAPIAQDEPRRRLFYNQHNLAWAQDTTWDEFLGAYWGNSAATANLLIDMPICHATTQNCTGLAQPLKTLVGHQHLLYFPFMKR